MELLILACRWGPATTAQFNSFWAIFPWRAFALASSILLLETNLLCSRRRRRQLSSSPQKKSYDFRKLAMCGKQTGWLQLHRTFSSAQWLCPTSHFGFDFDSRDPLLSRHSALATLGVIPGLSSTQRVVSCLTRSSCIFRLRKTRFSCLISCNILRTYCKPSFVLTTTTVDAILISM